MGMSTHIDGIREPDDSWKRMKAVWDACREAGVSLPREVNEYFDGETPDPDGVVLNLMDGAHHIAREWSGLFDTGYEITVADIPAGVTKIRFYNSW